MKPPHVYLLSVGLLVALVLATLLITPSEGQIASVYNQKNLQLRTNTTNPFVAYSSMTNVARQMRSTSTTVRPAVTTSTAKTTETSTAEVGGSTEEATKLEISTVDEGATAEEATITEETATVVAGEGSTQEEPSEEEDSEEVDDENSATEEEDEAQEE